jgi:hypothetical protein
VGDPLLRAKAIERLPAFGAEAALGRAGAVVEAGVDDPAVVAALVRGYTMLGLEDQDRPAAADELVSGRQADDAGADDGDGETSRAQSRCSLTE